MSSIILLVGSVRYLEAMKRILVYLLLVASCWAQERPDVVHDISGVWHSSTGATIEISPYEYGPDQTFALQARLPGGRRLTLQAQWLAGFRQQFRYRTPDGDEVWGVVDRDGDEIQLGNDKKFRAHWTR